MPNSNRKDPEGKITVNLKEKSISIEGTKKFVSDMVRPFLILGVIAGATFFLAVWALKLGVFG